MDENRWDELEKIFQDAKIKGTNKYELAEILNQQLYASNDTSDALETWENYSKALKDNLVDQEALTWQNTFEVAANLAKNVEDAWEIFMIFMTPERIDCPEAEAAFDKLMSMCKFQEEIMEKLEILASWCMSLELEKCFVKGFARARELPQEPEELDEQ